MRYKPNRGGHAPGHLREAFQEWTEDQESNVVMIDDKIKPLQWIVGKLWNCTDILPGYICDMLDIPTSSNYAQAMRHVKYRKNL